jgi:hypothetical protein
MKITKCDCCKLQIGCADNEVQTTQWEITWVNIALNNNFVHDCCIECYERCKTVLTSIIRDIRHEK